MASRVLRPWALAAALCWLASAAFAQPDDSALEARMLALTSELRCLVCQNDSVAHSTAALAADLRRDVLERLRRGEDEAQIVEALRQRYGDALLYRPPLRAATLVLWFGPPALLAAGLLALGVALRRRAAHETGNGAESGAESSTEDGADDAV